MTLKRRAMSVSVAGETGELIDRIVAELRAEFESLDMRRGHVIDAALKGKTTDSIRQAMGLGSRTKERPHA